MGVDYSVTLGVGTVFRHKHDAQNFLKENLSLDDNAEEEMEDDFGSFVYDNIEVDCMDCYNGSHWFVGVPLFQSGDPVRFLKDVEKSIEQWKEVFPEIPSEIICEVKVY